MLVAGLASLALLLGLALPMPQSDAAQGTKAWASGNVNFHKEGDWSGVSEEIEDALGLADNIWRNGTDWNPKIVSTAQRNDIMWGERPSGWASGNCRRPSATTGRVVRARECTKLRSSGSNEIVESDIIFNSTLTWTAASLKGIAVHELGHSAGLVHDPDPPGNAMCEQSETNRWTMCASWTNSNMSRAASLEQHDINDVNRKY